MVEQLTTKNLNMEERIMEQTETIADLEQLNMMNEELQENQREEEIELREEVDLEKAKVREVRTIYYYIHQKLLQFYLKTV